MKRYPIAAAILGVIIGILATLTIQSIDSKRKMMKVENRDWRKVNLILQCIKDNYVDTIDTKAVTEAIANAALAELDPHSQYLPPVSREEAVANLAGNFDGIGVQFNVPNDTAIIIEVIPGGPSERSGLKSGDRILKVDSTVIAGVKFPQDSIVSRIKGKAGTKVNLTIKRDKEIIPFEITRGKIPTHSVDAAFMVGEKVGYLRLSKFSRTTSFEVLKACVDLSAQGMESLIFDLRDNSGGYLDQALEVANLFLAKDEAIVYMEGLHRKREDFKADGKGPFQNIGLCILIDENSASSSEILAGALQDNKRATIVGRRSFGKGLVQEPFDFTDGSGLRITVARFYTPSGRCIQKPYSDDYNYEVYKRYNSGEMVSADSMHVEDGGILPDLFVPIDTTAAGPFFVACSRKATTVRFSSDYFDRHKDELSQIDDYDKLIAYLKSSNIEEAFLKFAHQKDGLQPKRSEWETDRKYIMTQVEALVGRYSKLGDNAYYHIFLQTDNCFEKAWDSLSSL